jgi:multidrug efflux pump subunit AcrA (membrane-fusion protein)
MVSKELKKLSRRELVDIIYQMKKNEQEMQEEISALKEELQDRRIRIETAGSVAEAAVSISNVLFSAQVTADLYLNEITAMRSAAEEDCAKMIEAAKREAEEQVSAAEKRLEELKVRYKVEYEKWKDFQDGFRVEESTKEVKSNEETEDGKQT